MQVKELIALLADMDPEADVVFFRDVEPAFEENDGEVQEIELTADDVVLGASYVGFQIPNEGYESRDEDDDEDDTDCEP